MSEEALWAELLRVAKENAVREAPAPFEQAYAAVARCVSIGHRLGVELPHGDLLSRETFDGPELREFFQRSWRLALLHAEQRRVGQIEARGGVDVDAADLERLRERVADIRALLLSFGWLPDPVKRRQLDRLEAMLSDLQRARDDFDVALGDIDDPVKARALEIGRPSPLAGIVYRLLGIAGPVRRGPPALDHEPAAAARALPGPNGRG